MPRDVERLWLRVAPRRKVHCMLLVMQRLQVMLHRLIVLFERFGEMMAALSSGNEVKSPGDLGMDGRLQRIKSWQAYRCRWQSSARISVVRCIVKQIGFANIAVIGFA